ncbi:MAG TPA: MlaD family protein [Urbifossiella sp.]|nr:MlaD family protein [Urbifossiella sp.]
MTESLSRGQAAVLGLVVVAAVAAAAYGLVRVGDRHAFRDGAAELTVGFPEAHDVGPGMPVRVRGVDAGEVVAVEYPDHDGPGAEVTVRLRVKKELAGRLYADAAARVLSGGVFGSKVVAIDPGRPGAGPLADGRLKGLPPTGLDEAVADARAVATEVKALAADARATSAEARRLLKDVRDGDGTLGKLVKDDDLYRDLKGLTADARNAIKRVDGAVDTVQGEVASVRGFVADGRASLQSMKQGTDAISKLPVVRSYVENSAELLVRPNMQRFQRVYQANDIFQPRTAQIHDVGYTHLDKCLHLFTEIGGGKAELVVVAFADPNDAGYTPASALETTRKQAEALNNYFRDHNVHKLGWVSRRTMTPLGMGFSPSPVVENPPLPASNIQLLLFSPP